ncbi:MAG: helix-turn-helix domain-containing protein [Dongiaceae bacterium]
MNAPKADLGGAPVARPMSAGQQWRVTEYICAAGPSDRPFEESHEQVTIAAVIEGSFNYRGDTGRAVLYPGTFLLGNSGACYECGHDHSTGDRCVALQLAPEYFSEVAASIAGSSRFAFPTAMLPAMPRVLPWLVWVEARAASADDLEIDESVPRLMESVIESLCGPAPRRARVSARDERRVHETRRYIEIHADESLNLGLLAGVAAMSKYHFLRTFRHTVGMTPHQFLLSVRMRRAAMRLTTTAEPVSTIAFATGFGDLSTFNARFRDAFGVSPTAYRRQRRAA